MADEHRLRADDWGARDQDLSSRAPFGHRSSHCRLRSAPFLRSSSPHGFVEKDRHFLEEEWLFVEKGDFYLEKESLRVEDDCLFINESFHCVEKKGRMRKGSFRRRLAAAGSRVALFVVVTKREDCSRGQAVGLDEGDVRFEKKAV